MTLGKISCALLMVALTALSAADASSLKSSGTPWKEGENYTSVSAAPARVVGDKVEVLEFFRYNCPHCYTMEPYAVLLKQMLGDNATVTRVPTVFRPEQRSLARLYYTLQTLGRIDSPSRADLHHEIFDTFHRLGQPLFVLNDDEKSFQLQLQFAVASGINADEFSKAYRSAAVEASVQRAEQLALAYRIEGTPMFVVGGKYKTDAGQAGSAGKLMTLLMDLVVQSRSN